MNGGKRDFFYNIKAVALNQIISMLFLLKNNAHWDTFVV